MVEGLRSDEVFRVSLWPAYGIPGYGIDEDDRGFCYLCGHEFDRALQESDELVAVLDDLKQQERFLICPSCVEVGPNKAGGRALKYAREFESYAHAALRKARGLRERAARLRTIGCVDVWPGRVTETAIDEPAYAV